MHVRDFISFKRVVPDCEKMSTNYVRHLPHVLDIPFFVPSIPMNQLNQIHDKSREWYWNFETRKKEEYMPQLPQMGLFVNINLFLNSCSSYQLKLNKWYVMVQNHKKKHGLVLSDTD